MKMEYDVPVPPRGKGRPPKYNWSGMRVGGSVAFPIKGGAFIRARASADKYFRVRKWTMTSRTLGEFGRIWRVK